MDFEFDDFDEPQTFRLRKAVEWFVRDPAVLWARLIRSAMEGAQTNGPLQRSLAASRGVITSEELTTKRRMTTGAAFDNVSPGFRSIR